MADDSNDLRMALTTVATRDDADRLARSLVENRLAACVQIDGPIVSHYRWQGRIERDKEFRLSIKTTAGRWSALADSIAAEHPYDEPQLVAVAIVDAADGYRDWVIDQTRQGS